MPGKHRSLALLMTISALLLCLTPCSWAESDNRVCLWILPELTVDTLANDAVWQSLADRACLGLISPRMVGGSVYPPLVSESGSGRYCWLEETDLGLAAVSIEALLPQLKNGDLIVVSGLSPQGARASGGCSLRPVLLLGPSVPAGLTSSTSTRRTSVVTPGDLTATIGLWLDQRLPAGFEGQPLRVIPNETPLAQLRRVYTAVSQWEATRAPLVRSYVGVCIILLATGLVGAVAVPPRRRRWAAVALAWLVALPLASLLAGFTYPAGTTLEGAAIALTAVLLVWLVRCLPTAAMKREEAAHFWLATLTSLVLTVDTWTGARLQQGSPLGYSVATGARFYGMGNEYMGVYIGSLVVMMALLFQASQPQSRWWVCTSVVAVLTVGYPASGANFGGLVTMVGAMIGVGCLWWPRRAGSLTGWLVALGMAVVGNHWWSLQSSHIGQALRLVSGEGVGSLRPIASRKLLMNLRLLYYTNWTWVMLLAVLVWIVLSVAPVGFLARLRSRQPYLWAGSLAAIVAAVIGLAVNDSGVVAASMLLVPVSSVLLSKAIYRDEIDGPDESSTSVTKSQMASDEDRVG
ncbi:MAG: hypothetical protein AB1331_01365 [Bacillota bacterium]